MTVASLPTAVAPLAGVEEPGDQVMALRVLAAGHSIIAACLVLVLLLQASLCVFAFLGGAVPGSAAPVSSCALMPEGLSCG